MSRTVLAFMAFALWAISQPSGVAHAEVFYARNEALGLAFPESAHVQRKTVFLTEEQVTKIREEAGVELDSRLFSYYVASQGADVVGYAVIETHTVRTLPETFLVVLSLSGEISKVVLLAFYEPQEYMPPDRWLEQFEQRDLSSSGWRVGRDLHGISGATLTANAVTQALRKILVLHRLVMQVEPVL